METFRLPGSEERVISLRWPSLRVLMEHSKRRLPERVAFLTSPGNGDGPGWRKKLGSRVAGRRGESPPKACCGSAEDGEAFLASVHPGVGAEDVVANTGWPLRVSGSLTKRRLPVPRSCGRFGSMTGRGFGRSRGIAVSLANSPALRAPQR